MSESRNVHSITQRLFKSIKKQMDQIKRDADVISSVPMHQSYLCQICQVVLDGFRPAEIHDFGASLILESDRLIEDSALEDCHLCSLLVSKISAEKLKIMREHQTRRQTGSEDAFRSRYIRNSGVVNTGSLRLMLWFQHDLKEVEDCGIDVRLSLLPERDLMGRGQMPEAFELSTGSQGSLDSARRWLSDCTLTHTQCGNSEPTFLPTRLIDTASLSEAAQPRLCHAVELPQGSKYATLSHCWGGIMPKRLLQNDLSTMLRGISVEELPKSFRDAIRVVRHLGIRYLWIDSLCIIQDSDDDWQKESALMESVYAHGVCNIAAADAADSTEGLFRSRNPQVLRPLKVQIGGIQHKGSHFVGDDSWWTDDVQLSLLSERGWVCQERIFSPRILHFGSQQIYWECNNQRSCESFPGNMSQEICAYSPKTIDPVGSKQQAIEFWENVVGDYTGALITKSTDKLVAISSLAAMVQRVLDSDYFAGLWARDIIHQLLWQVDEVSREFTRARYATYIAPSWSWASIDGPIRFNTHFGFDEGPEFNIDLVTNIVTSVTLVSNKAPFGQVKAGHMTLQGRLIDVSNLAPDLEWQQQASVRVAICRRGHDEWGLDYRIHPDEIVPDRGDDLLPEEAEEVEATATSDKYYLLPLRRIDTYRSAGLDDDSQFHGLVLKDAVNSGGSQNFSRWGEFRIDGFEGDKKIRDGWRDFDANNTGDGGLERVYDEELGAFKYTITII